MFASGFKWLDWAINEVTQIDFTLISPWTIGSMGLVCRKHKPLAIPINIWILCSQDKIGVLISPENEMYIKKGKRKLSALPPFLEFIVNALSLN